MCTQHLNHDPSSRCVLNLAIVCAPAVVLCMYG